jgi:membrane protease YdiL (CAAX protease family)
MTLPGASSSPGDYDGEPAGDTADVPANLPESSPTPARQPAPSDRIDPATFFDNAKSPGKPSASHLLDDDLESRSLQAVFKVFLIYLATSIVHSAVLHSMDERDVYTADRQHAYQSLLVIVEVVDALIVVGALLWIGRPPRQRSPVGLARVRGGLAGVGLMAAALGVNLLYHRLLSAYIFPNGSPDLGLATQGPLLFAILTTLIQPAIVEELFFRYLVLDNLRSVTSMHAAVWISSIAFAMAHLYNPLGIPVLILVGAALAYARVWSGSLLLPMALHALHNGVILLTE